jgi:hypothetical protein
MAIWSIWYILVYLHTKYNLNFCLFLKASEWEIWVNFIAIGEIRGHLIDVIFFRFAMLYEQKMWQPLCGQTADVPLSEKGLFFLFSFSPAKLR